MPGPGLFSWYNNSYASWNRMRRIQTAPFVARTDSRTSRTATAMRNGTDVTAASGNNPNAGANAGDVVINMADLSLGSPLPLNKDNKDTLFGPSIGVVNTAPEWCATDAELDEKAFKSEEELEFDEKGEDSDVDELTPEIVKEWVRRSKEPSEPTTTLQALVNLKRPSIRLSPLAGPDPSSASLPDESTDALVPEKHHQQHGLEFEYDCDAPQCLISLHAVGVPASLGDPDEQQHHDTLQVPGGGNANAKDKENDRLVLFETTLPGGFAKKLTLADGAVLELAKLEAAAKAHRAQLAAAAAAASAANSADASKVDLSAANAHTRDQHHRKRHTFFKKRGHLLLHSHNSNSQPGSGTSTPPPEAPAVATGPALAVVDAEAPPHHPNALSPQNQNALATFFAGGDAERAMQKKGSEEGVRIAIRLAARDADGHPMRVRNEQVTYLHIVRQGPPATSTVGGAAEDATMGSGAGAEQEQAERRNATRTDNDEKEKGDTRPWVVRVVKREARIGAHSFQLHEIYGLTAHASASDAAHQPDSVTPSSPTAPVEHTYPPTAGQPQTVLNGGEAEDSSAECLLCLSAAREVVLLPCRHLVACRDCAVNMVEFGAGGTVVQPAEAETQAPAPAAADTAAGPGAGENTGENNGQEQATPTAPAPTAPTPATRRKRKAKGWFCPVCRQPYTSLLRITTTPPPAKGAGLPHAGSNFSSGDAKRVSLASSIDAEAESSPANASPAARPLATVAESGATSINEDHAQLGNTFARNPNANAMESRGTFASLTRPGFLRHFSGRARERDLERGAAVA